MELDVTNDGLSDMAFNNMGRVRLVADKIGTKSDHCFTSLGGVSSNNNSNTSSNASADRHERAQVLVNHVVSNAKGKPVQSNTQQTTEVVEEEQTTVLTFNPKPKK